MGQKESSGLGAPTWACNFQGLHSPLRRNYCSFLATTSSISIIPSRKFWRLEYPLLCPLTFRSCANHRATALCIIKTIRLSCWGVEARAKHGKESGSCRSRLPYWWRMWAHDSGSVVGCLGVTKRHCRGAEQKESMLYVAKPKIVKRCLQTNKLSS